MRDFAVRACGNVSMAMSNGLHAIMLDVTRSADTVVSDYISDIGFSAPLSSTAVGRAILSLMTSGERYALPTRPLETAPHLAGEKAATDLGAEPCKANGFFFISSVTPPTLPAATP